MRLVLILSAVGITIVALRIFFVLKTAHTDAPQGQKSSREEKTVPPTQAVLFQAQMLAAPLVSSVQCLRRFPPEPRGRKLKEKKCGSIATTVGWCSATTIGFIFGRTFSSGIESPLPKPTPRPSLEGRFSVQCDDCRKEYFYKPSEVLKYEQELSDSFTPHPLFRNC